MGFCLQTKMSYPFPHVHGLFAPWLQLDIYDLHNLQQLSWSQIKGKPQPVISSRQLQLWCFVGPLCSSPRCSARKPKCTVYLKSTDISDSIFEQYYSQFPQNPNLKLAVYWFGRQTVMIHVSAIKIS